MALPYTTQVIKETLRMYPPMPVTIRRSLKDGTLGRYRIRNGDIILVGRSPRSATPGTGARTWPVRPGAVRDGQGRRPAAAAFIPFRSGSGSAWPKRSRS